MVDERRKTIDKGRLDDVERIKFTMRNRTGGFWIASQSRANTTT
jgi:hypothetical protein